MNSRNGSRNATALNLKDSRKKNASKRFFQNYRPHQNWSLPDSIIYYIAKNPSTSKVYQKMVQCCKYFYVKNQIIVIHKLSYGIGKVKWTTSVGRKSFDLDNIGCKLWITESVDIRTKISATGMRNLVSSIASKIYRCDAEYLYINYQNFSYENYCSLSSYAKHIEFREVIIKNADGSMTPFEKLIKASPKLKIASFTSNTILSNITSNTVQELVKLPNFSKLKLLTLDEIPETFNLDAFYILMKANNFTKFHSAFAESISDGYKKRLEEIIDEILEAEENEKIDFKPPFIIFDEFDVVKAEKLFDICCAY